MTDHPFGRRPPRADIDDTFPARLAEPLGPVLFGTTRHLVPILVAADLLELVAVRGGTRVRPSEVREVLEQLSRAVTSDVRAHCKDEARRIAEWIEHPPIEPPAQPPADDLGLMHAADIRSRISVAEWAIASGLDLELEWYHDDSKTWPRGRGTPLRLEKADDDDCVILQTHTGEVTIPVVNIRWLMPVEPREMPWAPVARVLPFPGRSSSEEE